jgi:hypothetical protein
VQAAGAAIVLVGAGALAVIAHRGAAGRTPFEDGLLAAALAYDRALALFGMGLALARLPSLARSPSVVVLAIAIAAGIGGEGDLANSGFVAGHLSVIALPGPVACVIAGLLLALPLRPQKWILPILTTVSGFLVGLAIGLAAPAGEILAFGTGGTIGSLWFAVMPALLLPPLGITWARILVRILGSWLIAIGVMLGASRLIAAKPPVETLPLPSPALSPPAVAPHRGAEEFRQEP